MYIQIWAKRYLRLVIIYQQHADCRRKQNEMLFLDEYYVFRYTNIK